MNSVNNVITAIAPLQLRDKLNSGVFAGVLNGFCYLGSTISSYGLGVIADGGGWKLVFYCLLGISGVSMFLALGMGIKRYLKGKRSKNIETITMDSK